MNEVLKSLMFGFDSAMQILLMTIGGFMAFFVVLLVAALTVATVFAIVEQLLIRLKQWGF